MVCRRGDLFAATLSRKSRNKFVVSWELRWEANPAGIPKKQLLLPQMPVTLAYTKYPGWEPYATDR